jgi:hypothetical protein
MASCGVWPTPCSAVNDQLFAGRRRDSRKGPADSTLGIRHEPPTAVPRALGRCVVAGWIRGSDSSGTANRLKRWPSPAAISAFHARIAFREAVVVVRVAGDVAQQFAHGLVKVLIVAVGCLQLVLAVRSALDVVLLKTIVLTPSFTVNLFSCRD